jgi:alpha-tubulin suppressor-like RCC1 family protein
VRRIDRVSAYVGCGTRSPCFCGEEHSDGMDDADASWQNREREMDLLAHHRSRGLRLRGTTLALAGLVAGLTIAIGASAASASNRVWAEGRTDWGRLGNGITLVVEGSEAIASPAAVCAVGSEGQCPIGPYLNEVTAISASSTNPFSLALLNQGTVVAWGENELGQLGDGTHTGPETCGRKGRVEVERIETKPCSATPVGVSGLSGVSAVAAGGAHSLALLSNGTVMAWGYNGQGQLGDGTTTNRDLPVAVSGLSGVTAISAGAVHSLAVLSNGTVMAWGANEWGQLGDGTTKNRHAPVAVSGLSGVTAISAGGYESLALLSNGTARSWGGNGYGLLGDGSTESEFSDVPVAVSGLSSVAALSAGLEDSMALLSNGAVMSWGHNFIGLLGIGGEAEVEGLAYSDVPISPCAAGINPSYQCTSGPYLGGVSAISAAPDHDMALLTTGAVVGWGQGGYGQLGNGTKYGGFSAYSYIPLEMRELSDVKGVSAGNNFSLAFGPVAPAVAGVNPTQGLEEGGTSVNIAGTNFTEGATVAFGSIGAAKVTVNSTSSITAVSPPGTGTVDVTVTTPEGTSSINPTDKFKYVPVPPPTVTKVKPNKGPVAGGTAVTITGASFTEVESVKFGSTDAANYTVNSASSITAVSPPETPRKVHVTVTTPIGTSALSSKDYFKYTPTVTSVSPNSGSKLGGTSVTITGTGFAVGNTATVLRFGTKKGTSVNCTSSTACTVVSPAHESGKVDVKATVNIVSSPKNAPADQFTYN